jgi:hypothetical protein
MYRESKATQERIVRELLTLEIHAWIIRVSGQVSKLPNSRHEPLLWLPDIIAWCYGRGGTWRDAVEPLVAEVIEI